MSLDEGILNQKRTRWQQEIRKKDLQLTFTKRRRQLIIDNFINEHTSDPESLQTISHIITFLPKQMLGQIIMYVIKLDYKLQLLLGITGIMPDYIPAPYVDLIKQTRQLIELPQYIGYHKIWQNESWLSQREEKIKEITILYEKWERQYGRYFQKIVSMINRFTDPNLLVQQFIIDFISFMANIFLIVKWANQAIRNQYKLPFEQSKIVKQFYSCVYILTNILAADDQKVSSIMKTIIYSLGNSIKCIGLYFNMFLVKGVDSNLSIQLFKNYVNVLSMNSQQFMNEHKQMICILKNGLKNMPQINGDNESIFVQSGSKLIQLINQLLRVLNFRYEHGGLYLKYQKTNLAEQDEQFIFHLSIVLNNLSSNRFIIRSIMQSSQIIKFMLTHLEISNHIITLKAAIQLMTILSKATSDHYAYDIFFSETRFLNKLLKIIQKISHYQFSMVQREIMVLLGQVLFVLSDLCFSQINFEKCLQKQILSAVNTIYFKLYNQSHTKDALLQCKYLFMNLMVGAKTYLIEHKENREQVIQKIFNSQKTVEIFAQILKTQNYRLFLQTGVRLIFSFASLDQDLGQNRFLDSFLSNQFLLQTLQNSENLKGNISQTSKKGIQILKKRLANKRNHQEYDMCV